MDIQDRIRRLQANVVRPGVNSAGVRPPAQQAAEESPEQRSDRLSGQAAAMSEDQFTDAFKRQVQARDAKLIEKANDSNAMIDRIRAARQTGVGDAPQLSVISQQMMYRPDGSQRPVPSQAMLDKWDDIDRQAGRQRTYGGGAVPVPPSEPRAVSPQNILPTDTGRNELPPVPRAPRSERLRQLTEAGLTPEEAARVEGTEHRIHGGVSPQLSAANDTPEAKAERARRIEGMRRTESRQDNYARGQLGGHLTGREAFEERAQQEGLRGAPAAKPQGWQPISQQDFTDRAAGYGLTPEAAARAYEERPDVMRGTGNDRVLQAQASRAQEEWLKTMPGVHRKHAQEDAAKYGDGTPADQITPEQYNARIERRNQERAALNPTYARERQIAKLAKASGKTHEQVADDMFPTGMPQPSEGFKERQAARKAQHARANEAIWERNGYRGHLDAKTSSGDPATVREGLSRLAEITGNPMYLERMKAMDAEDAAKGEHDRGMAKLTAEQKHALGMQDDAQAGDLDMEGARQKGAKDGRDDQAVENDKGRVWESGEKAADRGQALSVIELNQKNELERMEKAGTISDASAEKLATLRQKEATHAAGIAEERAAKDAERQRTQIETEGDQAVRVKQAERAAAGTPQSTANGYADEAFANPALSMGNSRNEMAAQLRSNHPHLSEPQSLELATSTLRRRSLMNAAGGSMHPGVRSHLTNEMKRLGDDGKPTVDQVTGKPSAPMTQDEFRAYANTHAGMDAATADKVYNDLNGTTTSAGQAELPPVPAGRVGPPRPAGERRSGGAWRQPTPEEVAKARADREKAKKPTKKHPYSRE